MNKKITKSKKNLLLPEIIAYLDFLDDVSDSEIEILTDMLDKTEKKNLSDYKAILSDQLTNKKYFCIYVIL